MEEEDKKRKSIKQHKGKVGTSSTVSKLDRINNEAFTTTR